MFDDANYSDNIHNEEEINQNWECYKKNASFFIQSGLLMTKDIPKGIDPISYGDVVEAVLRVFFKEYIPLDIIHNEEEVKRNYDQHKEITWICSRYHFFMGNEVPEGIEPDSYGDVVFAVLRVFFKEFFNEEEE